VTRSICRYRTHVCPFVALCYLFNDAIVSIIASNGRIGDQSGKNMARRGLCLNEVAATPALAQGTEKTHRPQDTQPRSRNSNSAPPEGTPEAIAYESHSSICLTSSSNYRFFNLREIQDSQCQRQPSHILLVIPISISQYNVSPCHTTRASFSN